MGSIYWPMYFRVKTKNFQVPRYNPHSTGFCYCCYCWTCQVNSHIKYLVFLKTKMFGVWGLSSCGRMYGTFQKASPHKLCDSMVCIVYLCKTCIHPIVPKRYQWLITQRQFKLIEWVMVMTVIVTAIGKVSSFNFLAPCKLWINTWSYGPTLEILHAAEVLFIISPQLRRLGECKII